MYQPKLTFIVTDAQTAQAFLSRTGQLQFFRQQGYEVSLISHPSDRLEEVGRKEGIAVYGVPLLRKISPGTDLKCLVQLTRLLRKIRPDIVNASTPKAGLLGMMAAKIARVPVRVYLLRGLRAETTAGRSQKLMHVCEKMASACAQDVISVSQSLQDKYLELGLCNEKKIQVLGSGSSTGVQSFRFEQTDEKKNIAKNIREQHAIGKQDHVIGFVGRVAKDKGVNDLVKAFQLLETSPNNRTHLMLVGEMEQNDLVDDETARLIERSPFIHLTGYTNKPDDYYGSFDLLAFASYREGFPNVPLEAAAAGLPVVAYRATGTSDAVVDEKTGLLIEKGNWKNLAAGMQSLLENTELRKKYGAQGRQRVLGEFQPETIFQHWTKFYKNALQKKGIVVPNNQLQLEQISNRAA